MKAAKKSTFDIRIDEIFIINKHSKFEIFNTNQHYILPTKLQSPVAK